MQFSLRPICDDRRSCKTVPSRSGLRIASFSLEVSECGVLSARPWHLARDVTPCGSGVKRDPINSRSAVSCREAGQDTEGEVKKTVAKEVEQNRQGAGR